MSSNILDILPWSDKGIGPTPLGNRRNWESKPNKGFWDLWNAHKSWFQERGVRVRKNEGGEFIVNFYQAVKETAFQKVQREASRADASEFRFPVPNGITPMPYQRAGVEYMVAHANKATLLGDEMGLGKTPQSIWACNIWKPAKVLIVCPASLIRNWEIEWKKFSTLHLKVNRVEENGDFPPNPQVVICSLDSTYRDWLHPLLHSVEWDVLIIDEAHRLMNETTNRSRAVLGGAGTKTSKEHPAIKAHRKVFITGTPIPSRTEQLWNLARSLWPDEFGDWFRFVKCYCDAKRGSGGLDSRGSSNEAELQAKLRSLGMIRRLKCDVLKELPPKVRQIIELPGKISIELNKATMEFEVAEETIEEFRAKRDLAAAAGDEDAFKESAAKLKEAKGVEFATMALIQRLTAEAKAPLVVHHVRDLLESGLAKVIIGGHHSVLIDTCMEGLKKFNPVKITGSCSKNQRHEAMVAFQNDPKARIMVANLQAAGVGLTMTAAHWTVMAEGSWVPADLQQFEDRTHRIGQEAESCTYQYLVMEGSLDAKKMQTCIRKMENQVKVLDERSDDELLDEEAFMDSTSSEQKQDVPEGGKRSLHEQGKEIPWDQVDAIHAALRRVAALDKDRASQANGVGFSRYDSVVGNSLADATKLTHAQAALGLKIVKKYSKQLDPSLYERATNFVPATGVE